MMQPMKIQWLPLEDVTRLAKYPLQSCLHTYATTQTLLQVFQQEPQSLELGLGLGRELVWSGFDEAQRPLIFRANQSWPKDRVMLNTLLPIGNDGLFPWRKLEAFRWLPPGFFSKILWVGDLPFYGEGYAVLREELSGQPWTIYKTPSKQDAEDLISFLKPFGEASYQSFSIENQERQYCLALSDQTGAFHFFDSFSPSSAEEGTPTQLAQKLVKRFVGREIFIFEDRVGGALVDRFIAKAG
jgi:hypothetical protein